MHPIPSFEGERIAALKATHILDSGPAPDFEAVIALVRDLFKVPICLVSLMDTDRQWFKAKCGLAIDGTDRNVAFCNYTLLSEEVFFVEDASRDPRFEANPLVTGEPHIRFYAAAPLLIGPGLALGSLCVIGTEPRKMSASEALILQRLATVVTSLVRGHGMAQDAVRFARDTEIQSLIIEDQARDLRIRERRFQQTEQIAKLGGWELDVATGIVSWSDEIYRIYDMPLGTPINLALALSAYPEAERARLETMLQRTMVDGAGFDAEFEFKTHAGSKKWVRVTADVEMRDETPQRMFGMFQDVSERHHIETRLWRAANRDALTGLANRNRFDELLGEAMAVPSLCPGLLLIDADHLKEVNDTLGHEAGDALICAISSRLRTTIGLTGTVARVGGDEFAVLVSARVSLQELDAIARAILDAMRPSFVFKGSTLKPSVSIGGSIGCATMDAEVLRQSADLALYHAKVHLRGGFVLFHDGLKTAITTRIAAINTIDDALTSGDVIAWYQPVVELATGRVSGVEALARVRCGEAMVSIGEFADALHDRRTATRLTARILERIEADAVEWRNAGIVVPRIAFNVGPLDFQEGTIETMLVSLCERTGFRPSQFAMEVTESVFLSRDAGLVAETAGRLRSRGVIVALDDFGTGHASLAHLGTFPVDVIKMDRSFVMRMTDEGPGSVVAGALIDLAHKLGIQVVAEGVEHEAQRDHLAALGCENAQGYLFSRPLPPATVASFIAAFQGSPIWTPVMSKHNSILDVLDERGIAQAS